MDLKQPLKEVLDGSGVVGRWTQIGGSSHIKHALHRPDLHFDELRSNLETHERAGAMLDVRCFFCGRHPFGGSGDSRRGYFGWLCVHFIGFRVNLGVDKCSYAELVLDRLLGEWLSIGLGG